MQSLDSTLLAALHDGMFQQPLWIEFLDGMRARTGAKFAMLAFRSSNDEVVTELFGSVSPPVDLQRTVAERYGRVPLSYHQMREGRVYALDELLDPGSPACTAWKADMLHQGLTSLRSIRVREESGVDAWLNCAGGREIGSSVGALLLALAPHVRIAMRNFITLERERFRSSLTSAAFGRLNFGWLTLDANCKIVDLTPHAEELFKRSASLRRGRYGRLTPASFAVDRELTAFVHRIADGTAIRPRAINVSRDPWLDMLVAPVHDPVVSAQPRACAIIYLRGDGWSQAGRCEQLVDLFGLLPSEARLAWAMAQGQSIDEAAVDLGLTTSTARSYTKQIYSKIGARGQADLVRTILTSILALA